MIRSATLKDVLSLNEIGFQYKQDFVKQYNLAKDITNLQKIILVYEDDKKIKGFILADNFIDNIDLLLIVVTTSWHHHHIGSQLLNYLISNYCYHNQTITLEVAINNINAIKLYQKYGFKIVNVRKKYYNNSVDAYLMKR